MRASPTLAFCPPDRFMPLSPIPVRSPDGSRDRSRCSAQSLITASYLGQEPGERGFAENVFSVVRSSQIVPGAEMAPSRMEARTTTNNKRSVLVIYAVITVFTMVRLIRKSREAPSPEIKVSMNRSCEWQTARLHPNRVFSCHRDGVCISPDRYLSRSMRLPNSIFSLSVPD